MKVGLSIILGSMLLVVLEALASYFWSSNFWPSQVVARWGKAGIAFFAHGGMWGDFFLLPTLFAFIITRYGNGWSAEQIAIMGAIGVLVTTANHVQLILNQPVPDPLGWQQEKWSTPIALHFVYMSLYVALAGLFYFSSGVSVKAAVFVSVVLGIHMALGTHIPLGIVNRFMDWWWCPDFLSNPGLLWMQFGIWAVLAIFATVAAGWTAGFWVAGFGASYMILLLTFIGFGPPAISPYGS